MYCGRGICAMAIIHLIHVLLPITIVRAMVPSCTIATVHAEQNAVADCAKRGVSCLGSTAYITHYPCINCCKLLIASGVTHIIYDEDYKNDQLVAELIDESNVVDICCIKTPTNSAPL